MLPQPAQLVLGVDQGPRSSERKVVAVSSRLGLQRGRAVSELAAPDGRPLSQTQGDPRVGRVAFAGRDPRGWSPLLTRRAAAFSALSNLLASVQKPTLPTPRSKSQRSSLRKIQEKKFSVERRIDRRAPLPPRATAAGEQRWSW